MSEVDVLVVGAGPAGNGVARKLADQGHSVVVLESKKRIGDKLCTGIVGRDCLERFGTVMPRIYRDLSAATFVLPSGKRIRIDMERAYAHVIDRVEFVASMARKAQEAGATYARNRKVTRVDAGGHGVKVRAVVNGTEEEFVGKTLVLASGFGSGFASSMGLGSVSNYVLGAQTEVETSETDETELYLGRRFAPGFFGWMVPTVPGQALVGLMVRRDPLGHLMELVSALRAEGKVKSTLKEPSKWGIPLQPPPRTFGDRILLVGDVAGQVKPTTGGGIYYSLLCAELAADTLHDALERDDFTAARLSHYESRWKARLGREMRVGFYARRFYEALGDRQVEFLTNTIAHNGIHRDVVQGSISSFDWHADLILKGMKHHAIRSVIAPLKALMPSLPWDRSG